MADKKVINATNQFISEVILYEIDRPIIIGAKVAKRVLGLVAKIHGFSDFNLYGYLLNFLKSGFLFSLKASLPSFASSDP